MNDRVRMYLLSSSDSSSSSDEEEVIYLRRRKLYKKRKNRFDEYDDVEFFERFRIKKATTLSLLQQIEHVLMPQSNNGGSISPMIQLLLTLRFYATGSMLTAIGDFMGVSKSSASRIIGRVSEAIASLGRRYIKMYENAAEMKEMAAQFYKLASFPGVIGAIDCTLIRIESPGGEDAEHFRSPKGFFAINVQTISDANLKIRNIVARWPGAAPDQTVFNNSVIKKQFENKKYDPYILIGDCDYTIEPYLMTTLQEVRTPADNLYNESIIRTRNVVEKQHSVWKKRFPILSTATRLSLQKTMTVIVATAIIHNIALDMKEEFPDEWLKDNVVEDVNENPVKQDGRQIQRTIIDQHFANLCP